MKKNQPVIGVTILILFAFLSQGVSASAQELHQDLQGTWRARVTNVVAEEMHTISGLGVTVPRQTLTVEILEGERTGKLLTIENDYQPLREGDIFFLDYLVTINGDEIYQIREIDRRKDLYLIIGLFAVVVLVFGRLQGLRSLASLAASFFVIFWLFLPAILRGVDPVLASLGFAMLILAVAMYVTHGFNRTTHAAFLGTVTTIFLTGFLAQWAVDTVRLTGFDTEAAVYLNFDTGGQLDFGALLLGAIIIGVLGVLDDVAITQASVVAELTQAAAHLSRREIFRKALRVGREHVGALVNTLALAYVGVSLPMLLLFYRSVESPALLMNREIIAIEIVRTAIGSIGLILAVPITTFLAIWLLVVRSAKQP